MRNSFLESVPSFPTSGSVLLLCFFLGGCPQKISGAGGSGGADAGKGDDAAAGTDVGDAAGIADTAGQGDPGSAADSGGDTGVFDAAIDVQVNCVAVKERARVAEAVEVRCEAEPPEGAGNPSWDASPSGGHLTDLGGGRCVFAVGKEDVEPGFGDTAFTVRAVYRVGGDEFTGSAQITVVGNVWVARGDSAAIDAFASDGSFVGQAAGPLSLDYPARALAGRRDGSVLAGQSTQGEVPPVVVLSRDGARLGAFDAKDFAQERLFSAESPRAILRVRDGTVWVTGGKRPVIFEESGRFKAYAAEAPSQTKGIAQMADGKVAVTFGAGLDLGIYAEDGAEFDSVLLPLDRNVYGEPGPLAALSDGSLLAASTHWDSGQNDWYGSIVRLDATLALDGELDAGARPYRDVASHILPFEDEILATPSIGSPVGACVARYSMDLSTKIGCLGDGAGMPQYRGLAHLE